MNFNKNDVGMIGLGTAIGVITATLVMPLVSSVNETFANLLESFVAPIVSKNVAKATEYDVDTEKYKIEASNSVSGDATETEIGF